MTTPLNSRRQRAVEWPAHPLLRVRGLAQIALIAAMMTSSTACVDVDGGAIELSWSLRSFTGAPIDDCGDTGIEQIRVRWNQCDETTCPIFACAQERGVTDFIVPEGTHSLSIEPLCADGRQPVDGTYQVPPPIERQVMRGRVVTLSALLIIASDNPKADVDAEGKAAQCPAAGCTCRPDA